MRIEYERLQVIGESKKSSGRGEEDGKRKLQPWETTDLRVKAGTGPSAPSATSQHRSTHGAMEWGCAGLGFPSPNALPKEDCNAARRSRRDAE